MCKEKYGGNAVVKFTKVAVVTAKSQTQKWEKDLENES